MGLLLLSARQINKDHLHPRLEQFGIERQRFTESCSRLFVVACLPQSLHNTIDITTTEGRVCQGEFRIYFESSPEVLNGGVEMFALNRVIDKCGEAIAP